MACCLFFVDRENFEKGGFFWQGERGKEVGGGGGCTDCLCFVAVVFFLKEVFSVTIWLFFLFALSNCLRISFQSVFICFLFPSKKREKNDSFTFCSEKKIRSKPK